MFYARLLISLCLALQGLPLALYRPVAAAETRTAVLARPNMLAPVLEAVVSISTVKFVDDQPGKVPPRRIDGYGSGFIVDPAGTIVTNRHVVEGTTNIQAVLEDGTTLPATPLYIAQEIDLAVLKVDAGRRLPALALGNSDSVQVGDPVVAIGNPLMLGFSVSAGIVSGLNRNILSGAFDNFIQTDAAINHGNSGGPLVNSAGKVIGINTAIYSPTATTGSEGLGFAEPSNDIAFIVDQVRRYGTVRAGWIGLDAQTVTPEIARALGMARREGAIVAGLAAKSPARQAGLREGDVVLKLDDREPADSRALARMIAETAPDTTVTLTIWREGLQSTLPVKIAEWKDHATKEEGGERVVVVRADTVDYGLELAPLNEDVRRELHLNAGQKGAVVSEVAVNSPAADGGFRSGDVVLRVQMEAVDGPDEARQLLVDALKQRRPVIIVLVQRTDGLLWLPLAASFSKG